MKIVGVYPIESREPVYLIEILIEDSKGKFDLTQITQEIPDQPKENWQVPYMEHILSQDGTEVIANDIEAMTKSELWEGRLRLIFFFHYLNCQKPLITPWGEIALPVITAKPERITVEYEDP